MAEQPHTIRTFALVVVTATSAFVMGMSYWLTTILAAPDWCARAINGEKLTGGRATSAIEGCRDLLFKQVGSLATNSHIFAGVIAMCLLVLMVIVIAGGRLSFSASKTGVTANVGKDDVPAAAEAVAEAAVDKAEQIKDAN